MASDRMPAWRKTGRRATRVHFEGLTQSALIEFPGYDNRGQQQGKIVGCIAGPAVETNISGGRVFQGQIIAVQDGYYEHWVAQTYGDYSEERVIPFHFCNAPAPDCTSHTAYRNPLHIDVFRILTVDQTLGLKWLSEEDKARLRDHPVVIGGAPASGTGDLPGPAPGAPSPPTGVVPDNAPRGGLAGIAGLAKALGEGDGRGGDTDGDSRSERGDGKKDKKRRRTDSRERSQKRKSEKGESSSDSEDLRKELDKKKPLEPKLSALDLSSLEKRRKKKKKKKSKDKKKKERYTPSTSSSTDSLFHSAALPKGMERLRRVHQQEPGKIASLSLQRLQELVLQTQGRGSASVQVERFPPVALGYVMNVFLVAHSMQEVGVRTVRELRTLATCIDLLCQNDPLRCLDVLVQRVKALEVAHQQGSWNQASQLELVLSDGQSAVFRPELKAAQAEVKEEMKLSQGPSRRLRWRPWNEDQGVADQTNPEGDKGGDQPPVNTPPKGGRKGKGKGKGKKGKRQRW